jgi:DnaD/phage-associated family protein
MSYQLNPALWSGVFAVPNAVVDEHLRLCSGLACKALLWILRHPNEANDAQSLAETLRQSPSDIADALNYWEEHGVLLRAGEATPIPAVATAASASEAASEEAPVSTAPAASTAVSQPIMSRVSRPHFPRDEAVSIVEKEPTLASLLEEGQSVMGKAFTSADLDSLVALYSYYGLSAHFILTAMHYCCSIGRRSVGYVESVCAAWINDGVTDDTVGETVDALNHRRTNEGIIRREFEIGQRRLTSREKEMIALWFDTYHMPIELITLAYEKAVEHTGKLSFSYINTILTAWHKKQIDTVEKAEAESLPRRRGAAKKEESAGSDDMMQRLVAEFMNE